MEFKNNGGHLNAAGTATSERFSLEGGNKKEVNLKMQPIGALIKTTFFNVDATKSGQIIYRISGEHEAGSGKGCLLLSALGVHP